jgi:hypothetical protein
MDAAHFLSMYAYEKIKCYDAIEIYCQVLSFSLYILFIDRYCRISVVIIH